MELHAENITAGYGEKEILHEVSLSVRGGEVVALLGPNGSGKSTLIKCMSRTLKPTNGRVMLNEQDLYMLPQKECAKHIAVVPQFEYPVFDFSVYEMVEMARYAWGGDKSASNDRIIRGALEQMQLEELSERSFSSLSGGEKQRVLFARALAQTTEVLLLDEPTAHMDVGYQISTFAHIRQLARGGKAVLTAVHDLNLASAFADKAGLMYNGRMVAFGNAEDVLMSDEIERVYGARFIRSRDPMTGSLHLTPEFIPERSQTERPKRIHIIGGGGTGAALLTELWQLGHHLSLGITHESDSDFLSANRLNVPMISAPPFVELREEHRKQAFEMAMDAEVVIVTSSPYGSGNLENLRLALELIKEGKEVVLIKRADAKWDFTGGQAEKMREELIRSGAKECDADEVLLFIGG